MNGETEVIYREEQKFWLWLRVLLVLSMVIAAALSIVPLVKTAAGQWRSNTGEIVLLFTMGVILPIGLSVLFCFLKLETEVRQDGLYVRYFPFHIRFKRFDVDDLSEYYARKYRPIWEYGGWGIRYSFGKGKAYNVRGNKGVQLVFKSGRRLLIGSQRAEELEEAIRSIIKVDF